MKTKSHLNMIFCGMVISVSYDFHSLYSQVSDISICSSIRSEVKKNSRNLGNIIIIIL